MKYKKEIRFGIIFSYINIVIQTLVYIFYTPLAIYYMGDSQYGVYALCTSLMTMLSIIEAGLARAYLKYYIEYKEENIEGKVEKLNAMFLIVFCSLALIACSIGISAAIYPDAMLGNKLTSEEIKLAQYLMIILSVNITFTFTGTVFSAHIRANDRYIFLKGVDVLRTIFNPFLSIFALLLGYRAIAVVTISLVITIVTLMINIVYCFKILNMRFIFSNLDFGLLKKYFSFSFYIFIQLMMDKLNWQIDQYILARVCGSVAVAIYSLGTQINTLFIKISITIVDVFAPKVHILSAQNRNTELTELFLRITRLQAMIVMFIYSGFLVFGKRFIYICFGDTYDKSYYIALMLMTPLIIISLHNMSDEILKANEKHRLQSVVGLAISVINFFISIPLCKEYGELGCALGTMVTMGVLFIPFKGMYLAKNTSIPIRRFYKNVGRIIITSSCVCILWNLCLDKNVEIMNISEYIFAIIGYTLIFWLIMFFIAFNRYEKKYLLKFIKSVIDHKK